MPFLKATLLFATAAAMGVHAVALPLTTAAPMDIQAVDHGLDRLPGPPPCAPSAYECVNSDIWVCDATRNMVFSGHCNPGCCRVYSWNDVKCVC